MRKTILTIFFVLIAALLVWTIFTVSKRSAAPMEQAPSAEVQPQVTEPAPDSLEALTADTLDAALADIDELTNNN